MNLVGGRKDFFPPMLTCLYEVFQIFLVRVIVVWGGCQDSFFLGVSDPYLDPDIAKEQALQRALFLYALREGVEIRMLQDCFLVTETDYGIDKQSNKLMLFLSLNFKIEGVVYEVLHQHCSQYGEVYVAITVRKDASGTGCLSGVSEFMQVVKESEKFVKYENFYV